MINTHMNVCDQHYVDANENFIWKYFDDLKTTHEHLLILMKIKTLKMLNILLT